MGWIENGAKRITSDRDTQQVFEAIFLHGVLIPLALIGYLLTELISWGLESLSSKDPGLLLFIVGCKYLGYSLLFFVGWFLFISLIDAFILTTKNVSRRLKR